MGNKSSLNRLSAFTRADALATLVAVMLLGGWLGFRYLGERGRIARCTWNLRALGGAMQSFANDHGDALPPAGIEAPQITWDMQLMPYLKPGLGKSDSPSAQMRLLKAVTPTFFCPSDPISRGDRPRSYAMSAHDMGPENWPLGPDNTTGLGLWWGENDEVRLLGHKSQNPDELALVKLSWLPDPANTLLLTEYPDKQNRMRSKYCVTIQGAAQQSSAINNLASPFHYHRVNYLMADGHVELLSPLGSIGIWNLKNGD
jgi:prepilin-type processing-associated H-X9-DG protein